MTPTEIITNPFFIMALVVIGLIVYFVFFVLKVNTPATQSCNSNQDFINGKCLDKCPSTSKRCGETCYDPTYFKCMSDNTTCDLATHYCPSADGTPKCCPSNQTCDNKVCIDCPATKHMCGSKCCDMEKNCREGNDCCEDDRYCKISGDESNKKCCQNACCDGICCNDGETPIIDASGNCTCKIKCQYGNVSCEPKTTHCLDDSTTSTSKCSPNQCSWKLPNIYPQKIQGASGAQYLLGQDVDGKLWLNKEGHNWNPEKNYIETTVDGTDIDPKLCTVDSCDKQYKGMEDIQYGKATSDTKVTGLTCKSNTLPNIYLPNTNTSGKEIPLETICEDLKGRCVQGTTPGSYTGQICPEGTIWRPKKVNNVDTTQYGCYCNISAVSGAQKRGLNCEYTKDLTMPGSCSGHGTPNDDGVCICDDKYKWNINKLTCTPKTFIDYFNRDFLERFLDDSKGFDALILIRVNSDPNFYPPKGQGDTSLPYWWNGQLADVAVSTIDTSGSRYNTNITIGDTVVKMHKCDTSSSGGAAYSHCLQLWPNDPNDKIYQNIYFKFYNWYDFKNRTTNNDDVDYANILIYSQYMYMDRSPNDMTPNDFNNVNNNQNIFCVKRTPVCVVP